MASLQPQPAFVLASPTLLCQNKTSVLVLLENLTFKVADNDSFTLKKFGKQLYDHLTNFAPTMEEFGGAISPEATT